MGGNLCHLDMPLSLKMFFSWAFVLTVFGRYI